MKGDLRCRFVIIFGIIWYVNEMNIQKRLGITTKVFVFKVFNVVDVYTIN